jgi:hypothetical protein
LGTHRSDAEQTTATTTKSNSIKRLVLFDTQNKNMTQTVALLAMVEAIAKTRWQTAQSALSKEFSRRRKKKG